ncbi:MAG: hypothetical protein VKI42_04065 [Synechococcaceae cyanobacterium]|nr:hypothetical protein [Synechococcaceae cyanobacterium]
MSNPCSHQRRAFSLLASFTAGALLSAAVTVAQQPNRRNALSQLQGARASLLAARPNKGGHRDRALDLVNRASVQVEAGLADAARF